MTPAPAPEATGLHAPLDRDGGITGLTSEEAGLRLRAHGPNTVVPRSSRAASTCLPYLRGSARVLHLQPLGPREWLMAFSLALIAAAWAAFAQFAATVRASGKQEVQTSEVADD